MHKTRGFTLMELLISIAIVGILAMVAFPSYQDSVLRSHRADGISAALQVQVAQEQFRGNCPYYAGSIGSSNTCGTDAASSTVEAPSTSPEGYYALSIESGSASGNSYTLLVDPQGSQADDTDCDPMKLTHNNANPNGLKEPADCW